MSEPTMSLLCTECVRSEAVALSVFAGLSVEETTVACACWLCIDCSKEVAA